MSKVRYALRLDRRCWRVFCLQLFATLISRFRGYVMKTLGLFCATALAVLTLGGCASGFQSFYRPTATPQQLQDLRANPPPDTPELRQASPPVAQAISEANREGYVVMGYSSFNGAHGSDSSALAEGKRVGADLVLVFNPQYTGTRSGAMPITTPTSQTTYYSGTATAYGSGGYATAYGSGTATTYGSRTTYIPFHVDRYDFLAVYLFKEHVHVGWIMRPLTDAQRQALGSNAGGYVENVVNGSPAFDADILPGDIVTAVDGHPIGSAQTLAYLKSRYGEPVTFTIFRNGAYLTKTFAPLR